MIIVFECEFVVMKVCCCVRNRESWLRFVARWNCYSHNYHSKEVTVQNQECLFGDLVLFSVDSRCSAEREGMCFLFGGRRSRHVFINQSMPFSLVLQNCSSSYSHCFASVAMIII